MEHIDVTGKEATKISQEVTNQTNQEQIDDVSDIEDPYDEWYDYYDETGHHTPYYDAIREDDERAQRQEWERGTELDSDSDSDDMNLTAGTA